MFRRLRRKMLLFNMITISLVIVSAFSAVYFVTYSDIEHENERQLQVISALPPMPDRAAPGRGDERPLGLERFGADYRVSFVLFARNGLIENINSHLDFEDHLYEEALERTGGGTSGKITLGGRRWAYLVSQQPLYGAERISFLDITTGANTLKQLLITLSGVGLAVLLVLLWFSYHFAVGAVHPIEVSYNRQKQFVADASHEFKTPLAIISASIDAIESSADESVESQREWLGHIRAELKRTTGLVDNLLYLAKVEDVAYGEPTPFDLSRACETVCASMEAVLYDREISLNTEIQENMVIPADGEKMTQVLYILLDNASKYTPRRGRIIFSLGLEQERVVLRVSNSGPGIAAGALPKIFDRFYRPDASRSQETGGFGLGLSIAKTIVERSGGEISAESDGETTTFTVRLKTA